MKALARAVINAAAFLELSDEDSVDPDLALQALEEISYNLNHADRAERQALVEALAEMRASEMETGPRPDVLEFLDSFLETFGLEDGSNTPDPEPPTRLNLL